MAGLNEIEISALEEELTELHRALIAQILNPTERNTLLYNAILREKRARDQNYEEKAYTSNCEDEDGENLNLAKNKKEKKVKLVLEEDEEELNRWRQNFYKNLAKRYENRKRRKHLLVNREKYNKCVLKLRQLKKLSYSPEVKRRIYVLDSSQQFLLERKTEKRIACYDDLFDIIRSCHIRLRLASSSDNIANIFAILSAKYANLLFHQVCEYFNARRTNLASAAYWNYFHIERDLLRCKLCPFSTNTGSIGETYRQIGAHVMDTHRIYAK